MTARWHVGEYYRNTNTGKMYKCTRIDPDCYVVLTRWMGHPFGAKRIDIDPAPEFWHLYEHLKTITLL